MLANSPLNSELFSRELRAIDARGTRDWRTPYLKLAAAALQDLGLWRAMDVG